MKRVNVVVVGDGDVGKTSLLKSFVSNSFEDEHNETLLSNYEHDYLYEGEMFSIGLCDTKSSNGCIGLHPLSYPETNIYLICYSVNNRKSFENVKDYWIPEIKQCANNVPFIVVATKNDLKLEDKQEERQEEEFEEEEQQETTKNNLVSKEEGLEFAKSIGAFDFIEVSSKVLENVEKLFNHVVHIFKYNKSLFNDEVKKGCCIC